MSRWQTTLQLNVGENLLNFVAFDVEGNIVGSDSIRVTSTVGWQTPAITVIEPTAARPGTFVTIRGTDFHNGIRVFFAGVEAAQVTFSEETEPTSLSAKLPPLSPSVVDVTVRNVDNRTSAPKAVTVLPTPEQFIRGDVNLDEVVDVSDGFKLLAHLYQNLPIACEDAADTDNNEALNLADALIILNLLFQNGPAPAAPYPSQSWDPDEQGPLGCARGLD
jgi:hypothetical protein